MRYLSGVTDQYIYFIAKDATDLTTRETGLSSFTVYRSRNGGAAAAYTSPTINETDNTNMPGVYELLLDEDMTLDAGDDMQEVCLHITHAGMAPVTRTFELCRAKITAGETLTVGGGFAGADVQEWLGTAPPTPTTAGVPQVEVVDYDDALAETPDVNVESMDDGVITAAKIASDAFTAAKFHSDVTTELQSGLATASALTTVGTNVSTAVTQTTAANIRTAVGLASANLDTQLGDLPTNAELATSQAAADDATLAAIAALNNVSTAQVAAAILAAGDVDGHSVESTLKLLLAALAGKLSGAATTTVAIRAADDSKTRITATVDADGNRSAVTLDATG